MKKCCNFDCNQGRNCPNRTPMNIDPLYIAFGFLIAVIVMIVSSL